MLSVVLLHYDLFYLFFKEGNVARMGVWTITWRWGRNFLLLAS